MLERRSQGRPRRGDAEGGLLKVVDGMRAAIRALKTASVSRKDIAQFAGVTPPLVSYYFPDRDALLEAAALPIVRDFANDVSECLKLDLPREQVLEATVSLILRYRLRDGALISAYEDHVALSSKRLKSPLDEARREVIQFFETWLAERDRFDIDPMMLQLTLAGMCEIILRMTNGNLTEGTRIVCSLIMQVIGLKFEDTLTFERTLVTGNGFCPIHPLAG